MELLGLPFELILEIWDSLETLSEKDVFTRTCRHFYDNFNHRLYRQAVTQGRREGVNRAVRLCGGSTLKKMLDAGLDPNDPFWSEETLLGRAVEAGLTENARVLIDAGANVNATERFGNSVASSAVFNGHAETLSLLFEKGLSIDFRVYEEPPLLAAVQYSYENIVEILLANNADVDEPGTEDAVDGTPLAWAARLSKAAIFHRLLRAGAKTNFTTPGNETLLHWAVQGGNERIVSTLLEEGADPHVVDNAGHSPLAWACRARRLSRNPEVVKLLLQQNVNTENKSNTLADTPLSLAARIGFTEAVRLLLGRNANRSVKNAWGQTPLLHAVTKGYAETVLALLEHAHQDEVGPSCKQFIDEPDIKGRTPLFLATNYGLEEIVKLILHYGSSAKESPTCAGRTPLSIVEMHMKSDHGVKCESLQNIWNLLQQESVGPIDREKITSVGEEWEEFEATCDTCDEPISPYDMHYHCSICDGNNFDICQECVASGGTCYDPTHTWQKTIIVDGSWKEISDSLNQDSIVEDLANLHVS
ncbi:hypothetical protein N7509_005956 [Penicillium cosmopolitanum]|uniref:ZZ-type domain-containing protein n=1 Tax=Penicillium cosmopolitanum TaxID=1131564 RepID=A0A9W9W3J4_9EURO|nr:uncharacterized protein N7509_005956 [Penicillium cosmopolitanum]KAJ5397843.1 hypothetical protein N7509_005956 [Penicillium cosmopolitanum]